MVKELFPQGDSEFAAAARNFVTVVGADPARYHTPVETIAAIAEAVTAYRDALAAQSQPHTRSRKTRMEKDATRAVAERLLREAANRIRANRDVDAVAKLNIHLKDRPSKLRARSCPQRPPVLKLMSFSHATGGAAGTHRIKFGDSAFLKSNSAKPAGAERLELFVDLVPHNEPIPTWPGERLGGRRWYLGSFTRSPLTVEYPLANEPMRVVYWGRWAAGNNDVGPDSQTLVTKVEGCDAKVLRLGALTKRHEQTVIVTSGFKQLPNLVERAEVNPNYLLPDETSEAA